MVKKLFLMSLVTLAAAGLGGAALAQDKPAEGKAVKGSLVEDRAARKLLEAGDARYESDETKEAVEVWKSVIERYPRSRVRFDAQMRLGNYYLDRDRAYDRARAHFEAVLVEDNRDEDQKAEATLKVGICFYEARIFGKCFEVMRDVIERYPVSPQVNEAYHYIGLGHFQLGHYSRAIDALEKVGTALDNEEGRADKVEAGKRLFIKIDDADLAALEFGTAVKVRCAVESGDSEIVECFPVGRNVRVVLGNILTRLGKPIKDNGQIEVKGDDTVTVYYIDQHTADKQVDRDILRKVAVIGNANVQVTDGAYKETVQGVVLDKPVNIQISDADQDLTDESDKIKGVVEIYRLKSDEELEAEAAAAAGTKDAAAPADKPAAPPASEDEAATGEEDQVEKLKLVDRVEIVLVEAKVERRVLKADDEEATDKPAGAADVKEGEAKEGATKEGAAKDAPAGKTAAAKDIPAGKAAAAKPATPAGEKPAAKKADPATEKAGADKPASEKPASGDAEKSAGKPATDEKPGQVKAVEEVVDDGTIHTGVFRGLLAMVKADEAVMTDETLQALPGDLLRVTYIDERNSSEGPRTRIMQVRSVEGNIGGVRVTKAVITDEELRLQTTLKTAAALTNIGNRYKEFGLKVSADSKYAQALAVCDEIMQEAQKLGGSALEQTYVQLWKIYFEMDRLDLAGAMCQRLQREFPTSGFVDEALLQLGDVARKQGNMQRAIGVYGQLVNMPTSQLRGEGQFGIAECYEALAEQSEGAAKTQMFDRAFQEYKRVFDDFPDSGRVGEAVAKMANHYYKQKDYSRAIDTFETVLTSHPDAKFLDVVLFNYGRCLFRMGKKAEARSKFDQLISEYPQSPLAADAKKISDALAKASAG